MSVVKKNIFANFVGSAWTSIISILFIPLYIHFMGIESYGLVGFYVTLQALFAIFDMGITSTISRELAKLSACKDSHQEMRNLMRTMELIYWIISILIISIIMLLAPWIASKWINASQTSSETIKLAIMLMGFLVGMRMLYGFYNGGLLGLQRQVISNVTKIAIETLKNAGVVIVLWLVSPTIIAFFIWQLGISILGVCIIIGVLWKSLPSSSDSAVFQPALVYRLWRFVAGISIITVLATILVQMDKVILSKMLPLDVFAYYALASVLAMGLYIFIAPVYSAIYPRFTQLVTTKSDESLKRLYHSSCQLITVLVMPVSVVASFFANEILYIWTRNEIISQSTSPILSILVIGTALNGMMNIPFALQLAHGWTRLAIFLNVTALVILIPGLIISVKYFGMIGAAIVWLILNAGYIVFGLRIMHKKLLNSEFKNWILHDFIYPSIGSFVVVFLFWILKPSQMNNLESILYLLLIYVLAIISTIALASNIRNELYPYLSKFFRAQFKFQKYRL